MDNKKIGEFISKLRKERKMTQKDLAKRLYITEQAVSKWERGLGYPDISLLKELSEIFNISINELLSGEKINKLTKEKADDITLNSIEFFSNNEKNTLKKSVMIFFSILLILFPLLMISISLILSCINYTIVFISTLFLFISFIIFMKICDDKKITNCLLIIICVLYSSILLSSFFYTGFSFLTFNNNIPRFESNFIPFRNIIEHINLFISGAQPISILFDYVLVDFVLFMPFSLMIPMLLDDRFNKYKFFGLMFIIICSKEVFQLITNFGVFNIDDIILNFLGLIISYEFLNKLNMVGSCKRL